jgi:TetR/AcrR family transcriptional regulator
MMRQMPRGDADRTRSKLVDATDALLIERPGKTPTVAELCARAEVNVAMVKYCFGSKSGLLDAVLERALERLAGEVERLARSGLRPEEQLRRHVSEIVRNYVRHPYVNRLMTQRLMLAEPEAVDRISRSFAIPVRAFYERLLADGHEQEGWREIDSTLFFFSVVGVCEFLFSARPLLERAYGERIDAELVERYGAHVAELVLNGVRTGAAPGP